MNTGKDYTSGNITAAYQGEPGAYSERAAMSYFGNDVNLSPSLTFESVFKKVLSGAAGYGIVPVENSLYGSVYETYDLLFSSKVSITGELYLKINHLLLGKAKDLSLIKRIYSHPQALGQCSGFLNSLQNVEVIPVYDTAGSAKMIAEMGDTESAAIASERAAKEYGLEVIKSDIQNNPENYTRFIVIESGEEKGENLGSREFTNPKTSVCFELESRPGTLARVLTSFASGDINLTKIESRPLAGQPFHYSFFADFIGDSRTPNVKKALQDLRDSSVFSKVLGTYESGERFA